MKIEKVNENQIRCTLTREDLASRELKISELAYGTEKAKTLFRDMMRQANFEFGFDAEDIPLMIEAIPLNAECIVLIITKVEDPEELDTRFARFAPSLTEDEEEEDSSDETDETDPEEVMDLFRRIQTPPAEAEASEHKEPAKDEAARDPLVNHIYMFRSLQQVMTVCRLISGHYRGESALYKDMKSGNYLLSFLTTEMLSHDFIRVCNIASEYGSIQRQLAHNTVFLREHCETLIAANAVEHLSL